MEDVYTIQLKDREIREDIKHMQHHNETLIHQYNRNGTIFLSSRSKLSPTTPTAPIHQREKVQKI